MIPLSREPLSANRRHVVATYTAAFALLAESVNRHQQRRDREKNAEKFDVRHRASPRFQPLCAKAGCHRVSPLGYADRIAQWDGKGKPFARHIAQTRIDERRRMVYDEGDQNHSRLPPGR